MLASLSCLSFVVALVLHLVDAGYVELFTLLGLALLAAAHASFADRLR